MLGNHAKKSLSASPRWSRCPGSIREEERYPNTSSSASVDGTGSHVLLELILNGDLREVRGGRFAKTTSYLGETVGLGHKDKPEGWVVDAERLARVMVAVNYVEQRLEDLAPDVILRTESKTDPGKKYDIDDMWGTVDITLIGGSVLEVIDYKDGRTYVSENTEQLLGYSDGQIEYAKQNFFNIKTVIKTIIQPKTKEAIRSVTHTREQNDKMAKELANAALLTEASDAELIPGTYQCKWCKHKPNCKARSQIAVNTINGPVEPVKMTNEQLAAANDAIPFVDSFVDSLKKEAEKRINEGQTVPGYEVSFGRKKNRVWIDEIVAEKKLRLMTVGGKRLKHAEYVSRELISPSMVLKFNLLPKQQALIINELTIQKDGDKKLQKIAENSITVEEMFSEEPLVSLKEIEEPLDGVKIEKELEAIFHPEETISSRVKERVLIMTEKAEGFTAADFKAESAGWTDELLVKEGHAIWSES